MTMRQPGLMFVAACVAALALRLILPAGWMPVAAADGVVISLCSGNTLPGDPATPGGDGGDQPCGFALALGPLLLATGLLLPLLALPAPLQPLPPRPRLHLVRPWPRPPGQGPPAA